MPCHARMPACMNTCMHECMHACMYVRRWGAFRNWCALALGTMKRGAYGPIGVAWQSIAVLTCLPLQSRSKKLVQSKVMETSGCSLMEFSQITHDLALHHHPTGPKNIERTINQQRQRSQQTTRKRASKTTSRITVSVCGVYTCRVVSCMCGTLVSSRGGCPLSLRFLADVTWFSSGGSFGKATSTLAVLALVNVLAGRASLFTSAP